MNETTDATAIFAPIWRRKWLILAVGIVVAAGSYFYYKRERPIFQATTQVFLGAAAEEQAPTEKAGKKSGGALAVIGSCGANHGAMSEPIATTTKSTRMTSTTLRPGW